jgi:serine/threonine protein kinase
MSGFVFELCELGNVSDNIFGENRTLSLWQDRLRVSCEVATGMRHVHHLGFIHRDLNTRNVVLTTDRTAKICDFGSARRLDDTGVFDPEFIEGSPSTMSPEQLAGHPLTRSSDVWQMAVLLWEVLGQRHPWAEILDPNDLAAMQEAVLRHGARLPRLSPAGLPPAVHAAADGLLARCFTAPPPARPTMDEISQILAAMLAAN